MKTPQRVLHWLNVGEKFPSVADAWGPQDPAPGLLAAGGTLNVLTLKEAYSEGIFPWFSEGQPILWWSPHPRMVLQTQDFKVHRSLRKSLKFFLNTPHCEIKFDSSFEQVITACAKKTRPGQPGTWIVSDIIDAYCALHKTGNAHSIETWIDGVLVGGLYCVSMGNMVFGESMFAHKTDASKIALCALVAFCRANHITMIDCQQNTQHLASLGAREISRKDFIAHLRNAVSNTAPKWQFESVYWNEILTAKLVLPPSAS